jgi:hypothetical protein
MYAVHRWAMTIDQSPADDRGTRAPRQWSLRQTLVAVAVAAVIAAFGGAAIYAATDGSRNQAFGHGMPGGFGGPGGGPESGGLRNPHPGGATVHGEFVTSDGAGNYLTMLTQTGTVTAVSPTSVTVRSADDFTQTYQLPAANGDHFSVHPNDEVVLRAARNGSTMTVTELQTQTRMSPGGPGGSGAHN